MAEERAAMHAGQEPFDDLPGPQIQLGRARDRLGMQEPAGGFFSGGHVKSLSDK
jgi:hypothetical protein